MFNRPYVNQLIELFRNGSTFEEVSLFAHEEFDNGMMLREEIDNIVRVASQIHVHTLAQGAK